MSEETAGSAAPAFRAWALVEVMGHRKLAGEVSEQVIAGAGFIRVDVPEVPGAEAFTSFFRPGSIYAITPVAEAVARHWCASHRERPIEVYGDSALARALRQPRLLPADDEADELLDD